MLTMGGFVNKVGVTAVEMNAFVARQWDLLGRERWTREVPIFTCS